MKTAKVLLFTICLSTLFACDHEEVLVNPDQLSGGWNLENVAINKIDNEEITDWMSVAFYLDKDQTYYRNYVSGKWSLDKNKLILEPVEGLGDFYWEYDIMLLTKTKLQVKLYLTDQQYCCDFEQFEDDEVLTIIETYSRQQ